MTPPTSSVTQHRRPVGYWLVALLLAVLCGSRELAAQESPPKPADTSSAADTKKAGPKSSELLAPDGTDVVRILGDDGRVYTLPAGRTLKQVLEALEKAEKPQAPAPDFYIASLSLDGKADSDRDRVEFNVTLEVQVQQTKKSVRIPLRFNEATMISQSSDRPGSMTFEATERNAGPVCWLTGEGKHVLKLKVSVPARRSATSQRLQLSLPATVQSRLVIEVPQSQLTVKAIDPLTAKPLESLDVQTEVIDVQRSRIVAHGLGTSLDLSWQGARESAPAKRELSSRTLMLAEVLPDGILLQASQTVRALQGTFSSVSVTLPEGFKIDSVEDRSGVPLPFRQQDNGRAVVSLNGETSGPVELIWYLRASIAGAAAKIQITNLVLDDATRQDGMLGVVRPESSTLRSLDAESQGLERIGAVTFRRFAETSLKRADASVSQAFSFDGACRAVFQLDRVVPRFIVRPTFELAFGDESVELEAKLELTVFRGTLESLTLKWPNWREEGWQIDVESEISVVPETGSSADEVVLGFGKALDRRNQPTVIQVRGRRQLTRAEDKTKLTLPTVVAPRRTIASLVVKNADNIESRLVAAEGTDLRLVGDSGATASKTIDAPENQRLRRYELHSETANFNATAMTQTQSVTCQPRTTLSVDESRIRVTQVFDYSVSYERLSAVRIVVPKLLADRAGGLGAQFWLVKSNEEVLWQVDGPNVERIPLTPVPTGVDVDGRQLRLAFPQPIWGHFRIAAQYSVPLSSAMVANESQTETVPILLCSDSTPKTSQLQVRAPDNVTVKIASGDWQPEVALERFPTWRADGGQRAVELDFKVTLSGARTCN